MNKMERIHDLIETMRISYTYALLGGRDYDNALDLARAASEQLLNVLEDNQ